jgi:uncharacterized membrane protein
MELLLLLGLVGLVIAHARLAGRVETLAREVERLERAGRVDVEERWASRPRVEPAHAHTQPSEAAELFVAPEAPPHHEGVDGKPKAEAEPVPEPAVEARVTHESVGGFFERWVGGRLMIWAGGAALAVAGVLLVRYSIQIGLITPAVQMGMAFLFGLALLALGEIARGRAAWAADPRVAQALVGAGILILYAASYGCLVVHHLIGGGTAFGLMVAATAVALVLSLRHGAPAAVMGLLGGFLTPLLVGEKSDTAIPLLTYLSLLDVALFALAGRRGWTWLAAVAALISLLWGGAVLFMTPFDAMAGGVFILAVALVASLIKAGEGWHLDFLRPAAFGLVELAGLVARGDVGLPAWALFATLAAACFVLEARRREFRPLPLVALVLALLLLALEAQPPASHLALIAGGITLLFAAGSVPAALRRDDPRLPFATFCLAFAAPVAIVRAARPELLERPLWGLLCLLLAAGPAWLAWTRRGHARAGGADLPLGIAAAAAALLLGLGAYDLVPPLLLAAAWLVVALGLALAARRVRDDGVAFIAYAGLALAGCVAIGAVPLLWQTLANSIVGMPASARSLPTPLVAAQDLLLPALLLVAIWRVVPAPLPRARLLPLGLAASFGGAAAYIAFKQIFGLTEEPADFVARGFAERTLLNQLLFLLGWLVCRGRLPIPGLDARGRWLAGTVLTALAAARLVWFDMLIQNPLLVEQNVGAWPVANLLVPAYLLSAFWLYRARLGADHELRSGVWLILSLASLVFGVMLMVRQGFQGPILDRRGIPSTESYGYSLAGLLLSIALLLGGIKGRDKAVRVAGLALLAATTVKVFLVDASALEGVLRILSFLVLGLALVGLGMLYGKVLNAEAGRG